MTQDIKTTPASDAQLDEWEKLANAATPGPWAYEAHGDTGHYGVGICYDLKDLELAFPLSGQVSSDVMVYDPVCAEVNGQANAAFIAAAREAIPALIGMVRERDAGKRILIEALANERIRSISAESRATAAEAEVERLREAGNALAAQSRSYQRGHSGTLPLGEALNRWDADARALEGKHEA